MPRWEPDARDRLERAALELFAEQGFAETTVPQITARAGLTTRSFFRHFADKREVLFAGEEQLPALVAAMMAQAPPSTPLSLIASGLETVAATRFEGRRAHLRARRALVQADEGLRERELRKLTVLSDAIRVGFLGRGVDELTATVAAQLAVAVLDVSVTRWLDQDDARPLTEHLRATLGAYRSVAAGQP